MTSDLSAQSLLQFTQLILLLQQRQSLVETLWDLQRYTATGHCQASMEEPKYKSINLWFFFFIVLSVPVLYMQLKNSERCLCAILYWRQKS